MQKINDFLHVSFFLINFATSKETVCPDLTCVSARKLQDKPGVIALRYNFINPIN